MIDFLNNNFTWILVFILLMNMSQRKIRQSDKKRQATIYLAALALVFYVGIVIIDMKELPAWTLAIDAVVTFAIGMLFRNRVWPFRLHCQECRKKLDYEHVIGHDDNLCPECHDKRHPEEAEERKRKEEEAERAKHPVASLQEEYNRADKVEDIDWELWEPTDRCVITYVEKEGKLLFIEKKRGLGNGYFNAPGGHIEEAETAVEAAIRETKEETGLDIQTPEYRGKLFFQFKEGIRELGYVYFAYGAEGELAECDEARPFWIDKDKIPYENMWEDDKLWLPGALKGKKFEAYFIFDDRKMVDSKVVWCEEE